MGSNPAWRIVFPPRIADPGNTAVTASYYANHSIEEADMKLAMALLAFAVAPLAAQDSTAARPAALQVVDAAIAKSVVDRAPQDTGSTFGADVAQLICWTKIEGASGDMTVHHVWFHGDQQVADVELHVAGSPWRTYSRKTVPADWTGAWHVEVRDANGTVLKRLDFKVGQ